ncbi:hypothetical protein [Rhodococcus erythropolis]|uniref:hypothetical protein n=1 Tax=Rhodococcus erythropolis TaxID=1833 RepID=UPI0022275ECA|nr:hypothetical protein [Rhodococcus erythropolis]MCW2300688.1 hypothetical protein [Rhodococcus erythropolis]
MMHTQMAPAYVAASNKKCPLTVPLAVLGEVDAPVFDALTTALAVQWPDESDVDPYDFDEITVEDGEIYFADEDRLVPAPSWSTGKWGMAVAGGLSALAFSSVGVLYVLSAFGGWPA